MITQHNAAVADPALTQEIRATYKNRELAMADLADYIDTFYNRTRRHSHLGGLVRTNSRRLTNRADSVSTESWELQPSCVR